MTEHRRDKMAIVGDILNALSGGPLKYTHLLYKSNLSHIRLKQYIDDLLERGLIEELEVAEGKRYRLTPAGVDACNLCQHVRNFTKGFGL